MNKLWPFTIVIVVQLLSSTESFHTRWSFHSTRIAPIQNHLNAIDQNAESIVTKVARTLQDRFFEIDMKTKARMDKILSLYEVSFQASVTCK